MYDQQLQEFQWKQHLFRPKIFKKYSSPDVWRLFEPFERVISEYEVNGQENLKLQPHEESCVWTLLKARCTEKDLEIIKKKPGDKSTVLRDAFCIEYRKAYPRSHDAAHADWLRSNFRYDHEFYAVTLGFLPWSVKYTKKRPGVAMKV